jgi:peptidoglycan/LPS O-acetylase OafA/YrhL
MIKGMAICLMLWHHLFYEHAEYGNLILQTAQFGKVCVSLFLFVSAYGLTVQYGRVCNKPIAETLKFQINRLAKFYINYWVIFLIFVPIGIFVFGRSLCIPYGDGNLHQFKMLVTDFLGINFFQSYNITWWFNCLIICLYFFFPFLYFAGKKHSILLLIVSVVIWKFNLPIFPEIIRNWLFVFSLGIVYSLNIDKINNFLNKINTWLLLGLLFVSLLALFCIRQNLIVHIQGIPTDGFICLNIIILAILTIRSIHIVNSMLQFLGKHSMNIYMVHTFIYHYFFGDYIYLFKYPLVIFAVLMLCSLGISIVVEYLKNIAHLPILVQNINQKIEKSNI